MKRIIWILLGLLALSAGAVAPHGRPAAAASPVDFYGRPINFLKLYGQTRWGDAAAGRVDGSKIYHAAGVVVDRSVVPNRIYVADTGNNRILGFSSAALTTADRVFGQADVTGSAANRDCNLGLLGPAARDSLCLMAFPIGTNVAEQWMRLNFDVDAEGNLYVPDFYNNRVLVYYQPYSPDRTNGKGDTLPDLVLGQPDFQANKVNAGNGAGQPRADTLYLSYGGFDHVSARGVSVDDAGNVWVADSFNFRVLRFPRGAKTADLVLGQPDFAHAAADPDMSRATMDRFCTPIIARVNPDNGELYVVDEYPGGFPARVLVFRPPFRNGMAAARVATPRQPLAGDYAGGYRLTHATGLVFNRFQTDDWIDPVTQTHRYREGVFWLHDSGIRGSRTLLLDADGNILQALGALSLTTFGLTDDVYRQSGLDPETDFNLRWPGGMMGFDTDNHLWLADETHHRVARFALPYRLRQTPGGPALPTAAGGLFPGHEPNNVGPAHLHADRIGVTTFGNQLIVRDHQRYMVWQDYAAGTDRGPASFVVGQPDGNSLERRNHLMGRSILAIDGGNRLWATGEHGRLMVYQLPLTADAAPLRDLVPLYWADAPDQEVDYRCEIALTYDRLRDDLWLYDQAHHRLLRVGNPSAWAGKLLVDAVIGQRDKQGSEVNGGSSVPGPATFGDVNDLEFDRNGNLFVVDNTYELHNNGRIIGFRSADLAAIRTLFPSIQATYLYVVKSFTTPVSAGAARLRPGPQPASPVSLTFDLRGRMIVGNDGYFEGDPALRSVNQLYLYEHPLENPDPQAVIELPMGAPGELACDAAGNLIVQDHTWNRVWILNLEQDPNWLRWLGSAPRYFLSAFPATVSRGGTLSVSWTAPAGASTTDWIALYKIGEPGWKWWGKTYGTKSGALSLAAPRTLGQYEFRYMLNNTYTVAATSAPVTVSDDYTLTPSATSVSGGGALSISWKAPAGTSTTDWIALYKVGEAGWKWWGKTLGKTSGKLDLTAPLAPGQYEFRYMVNNTYTVVTTSAPVTVK